MDTGTFYNSRWKTVSILDANYSICSIKKNSTWKICLTNLVDIWTETLSRKAIVQKCEILNPSLSIEDVDVYQFVCVLFEDILEHATKVSVKQIHLSSELEGGRFKFTIDFTRGSSEDLRDTVTIPLCVAAGELHRRYTIILDLMKRKDQEIAEYKLNGAELVRKHIETDPFHEDIFQKNLPTKNPANYMDAFETIINLHQEVKTERLSIKTEPEKTLSIESSDTPTPDVKIQLKDEPKEKTIDLVVDIGASENSQNTGKTTNNSLQVSNEIVPKTECNSLPVTPKKIKSLLEINNEKRINSKRSQITTDVQSKRQKQTIHDFIS